MEQMTKKHSWCNPNLGLLVLRIGIAIIFIMAGWMKVSDLGNTVAMFGQMGFSPMWAYVASFAEFIGGIAILFGVFTRFFASILLVVMIVATVKVHKDATLLLNIFSLLALAISGAGKYAITGRKDCSCGTCATCVVKDVTPNTNI